MKKSILLIGAAALLAACGSTPASSSSEASKSESESVSSSESASSSESVSSSAEVGASRNVSFSVNGEHLAGISTVGDYHGAFQYLYCPHVGDTFTVIPSFIGAYELDYITVDGVDTHYEAKVGEAGKTVKGNNGVQLSLEGIRYAEVVVPAGAPFSTFNLQVFSKAVEGATLANVELTVNNSTLDMGDDALNMNTYLGTNGTVTADFIVGSWVTWTMEGATTDDMEAFHDQSYSGGPAASAKATFSVKAGEADVPYIHNTLEDSIKDKMHTTGSFVMPSTNVALTVGYGYIAA